jgi:hypothetical protein
LIKSFISAVIIILAGGFAAVAYADHLEDKQQARGRPETKIAGIDLSRDKLADIIRRYGQPTRVKSWESDRPDWSSQYEYYWLKRGINLHVVVERLPKKDPKWEYIGLVEVDAGTSRKLGTTGKGLRVGDNLRDLKRIYGSRFKVRNIPKIKIHDVMIQWRQEEYALVATLDQHNRITGLSLAAPE